MDAKMIIDTRGPTSMHDLIRDAAIKRSKTESGRKQQDEYQHMFYSARVSRALHEMYHAIDRGDPKAHLVQLLSNLRVAISE